MEMPARKAPSLQWVYGRCIGGPLDGLYKDVPASAQPGQVLRYRAGRYIVGFPEGKRGCTLIWTGEDDAVSD